MKQLALLFIIAIHCQIIPSAQQRPRRPGNQNKRIAQMTNPQAPRNTISINDLSNQLCFMQWKLNQLEIQLQFNTQNLMQMQSTLMQILLNQQNNQSSIAASASQQQPAQQQQGTTQTNGVTFSQQHPIENQDLTSFSASELQGDYRYSNMALLNAASYTQVFVPRSYEQGSEEQEPFIEQEQVNTHNGIPGQPGQASSAGEARFLELFTEWNRTRGTDHKEQAKQQ